ncbi:DDE_Tnp_1_7 domain-containing protein [Trichonephila clavata]|uniref:DDE_Tnp_1_7 domain-containing protein n=1 Tax=Trichonephila clavata TaxID=2740835 RepID=A0A8X6GSS0_TRICU|nr:DDE_Tnp_1_7 domain-containing protein [Trichonephila clavata]
MRKLSSIRPGKGFRVLSSSDSDEETETTFQETETAATVWLKFDDGGIPGRLPSTCICKGGKEPTGYVKRNIMADNLINAFSLITHNYIIKHIKFHRRKLANLEYEWPIALPEIRAFIGILYARGAYEAQHLKLSYLRSKKWCPEFLRKTMAREKFKQIQQFIPFDKRTELASKKS